MKRPDSIVVCEIFGPTIQGEGMLIGQPTIFVRTGGCDYQCRWCDSRYAVEKTYRDEWQTLSPDEILKKIDLLSGGQPLLISLSGGNPALQPLGGLISMGKEAGYSFAMETQGSISREWFAELSFLVLSPKPPSSGMATDYEKLQQCIDASGAACLSLKIVVMDENDYQYARQLSPLFPEIPVYLQPGNDTFKEPEILVRGDRNTTFKRLDWLVAKVLADKWFTVRVLPQLHVLLWGNIRGR